MLGAIAGDIIGSVYEGQPTKTIQFPLFSPGSTFTDDTVTTIAIAQAILDHADYGESLRAYGQRYPDAGYGAAFSNWLFTPEPRPYHSWGNGAAMRVSAIGFAFSSIHQVLREARRSAEVTHNHPEGIKGARAVALAVFLARMGESKNNIKEAVCGRIGYDLHDSLAEIRPDYVFDVSCQGSVPESIVAFLESSDVESAIRNAVSLGGDADTMACIAGAIAFAYYKKLPVEIIIEIQRRLPGEFLTVIDNFNRRFHSWPEIWLAEEMTSV